MPGMNFDPKGIGQATAASGLWRKDRRRGALR
jgi:hypothetical protein